MNKPRVLLSALGAVLGVALAPTLALAANTNVNPSSRGVYAEIRAGAIFLENSDNDFNSTLGATTKFDTGYTASLALGAKLAHFAPHLALAKNFRVEAEASYSESNLRNVPGNGEATAAAYMTNAYYDFDLRDRWSGYVGGGVGVTLLSLDGSGLRDNDDTVFAYQVRAGVGYQLTSNLTATLGYRFFNTEDGRFTDGAGRRFDTEYRNHGVEAGLRYAF